MIGSKTPDSPGLKWPESIRSSAFRICGSCSDNLRSRASANETVQGKLPTRYADATETDRSYAKRTWRASAYEAPRVRAAMGRTVIYFLPSGRELPSDSSPRSCGSVPTDA